MPWRKASDRGPLPVTECLFLDRDWVGPSYWTYDPCVNVVVVIGRNEASVDQ